MVELIDIPSSKAVGMRIVGKIEGEGFDSVLAEFRKRLEGSDERLRIYIELEEFGGISFAALIEDMKMALPNFKRFERKAVVSDKSWVSNLAEFGDKLFPSIEVRSFKPEEKAEALKWVQE